jgi:hypothetical protein
MSTETAEALQDAELAHTDADLIAAGVAELEQLLTAGRLDSISVTEVARDLLPKLDALRTWLLEQIVEVTV